ncbi:radical SAM additional 4Fe4S-binding SPASM domain-containing protein [Thermoanaerobacter thermohydrosulfuricus]|uniref:Radical SAM 4Fe4S-binding domain protein n=2 Tax=Thermoanaerobacter thermohydrosulfuricus TaxID=1516 RepID=M8DN70_THETY|nr:MULTISPECIES: radical SAM protein [Thermoanaerobacter]EMT38016.1 radical SAM 4Fe4S-binding domain protein [Thermoanaerobacter thermohydrosulfuricus WC1]SDG41453.1 radical SAM additional 4Fe4S-binding SPASM domain-containing protein [Thermoanaerobacter thermohydrosulfuricus]
MKVSDFKKWINSYVQNKKNTEHDNSKISFFEYLEYIKKFVYSRKIDRLQFPLEIYIELTNRCNLDCIYCYKKVIGSRNDDILPEKAIDIIVENLGSNPAVLVILEGGEPLLHPRFIEIFYKFKEYSVAVDILTNGTLFTPEIVHDLAKIFSQKYDSVQISLDGLGDYNKVNRGIYGNLVLDNIKLLNDAGIIPRINCIVTKFNYLGTIDFIFYLEQNYKISSLSFNIPMGHSFQDLILADSEAIELYEKIIKIQDKLHFNIFGTIINIEPDCYNCPPVRNESKDLFMRCTALRAKICIAANGDVYPCVFMENRIPPLGNILRDSLQEIWESSYSIKFVQSLIQKNGRCLSCVNSQYCTQICWGRK